MTASASAYRDGPVALLLTRQGLPVIDQNKHSSAENLVKGAYVLWHGLPARENTAKMAVPHVLLLASGSEVAVVLEACGKLTAEGITPQVVSMPCWELFEKQSQRYKDSVLPPDVKARVGIEAGVELGWHKYLGDKGIFIGLSSFGASAPAKVCFEKLGITSDNVAKAAKKTIEISQLAK